MPRRHLGSIVPSISTRFSNPFTDNTDAYNPSWVASVCCSVIERGSFRSEIRDARSRVWVIRKDREVPGGPCASSSTRISIVLRETKSFGSMYLFGTSRGSKLFEVRATVVGGGGSKKLFYHFNERTGGVFFSSLQWQPRETNTTDLPTTAYSFSFSRRARATSHATSR